MFEKFVLLIEVQSDALDREYPPIPEIIQALRAEIGSFLDDLNPDDWRDTHGVEMRVTLLTVRQD